MHVVLTWPPLANEKSRPHAAMRLFLQTTAGPLKDDMGGWPSLFSGGSQLTARQFPPAAVGTRHNPTQPDAILDRERIGIN